MGVTAFYFHSSSNKCITTLKDFFVLFLWLLALKTMQTKEVKVVLCLRCNGPTPTCSYSWERCDTQQRLSITETFPREQLTWLGNKESAICYVSREVSLSSSLLRLALSIFCSYKWITWTFPWTLSTMVPRWRSLCHGRPLPVFPKPQIFHETALGWILCWAGRIALIFGNRLVPRVPPRLLSKTNSISFWEYS